MIQSTDWQNDMVEWLYAFGRGNWVVISDSSFPLLSAGGVEMVVTGRDQMPVIEFTVKSLSQISHLHARVWLDQELAHVTEAQAPGIDAFRKRIGALTKTARVAPHDELIARVSTAAAQYRALVVKTTSHLPYTNLFIEMDCGFWDPEREAALRAAMR